MRHRESTPPRGPSIINEANHHVVKVMYHTLTANETLRTAYSRNAVVMSLRVPRDVRSHPKHLLWIKSNSQSECTSELGLRPANSTRARAAGVALDLPTPLSEVNSPYRRSDDIGHHML